MQQYIKRINHLKKRLDFLKNQSFSVSETGTHHVVYLSDDYVIRFRDDNESLLERETKLLTDIDHSLVPNIVWSGRIDDHFLMIENRLPGKSLNSIWKDLKIAAKKQIAQQLIDFVIYLSSLEQKNIYSINLGKTFRTYDDYFNLMLKNKIVDVSKNKLAANLALSINKSIASIDISSLFDNTTKIVLIHGDLINHNLLSDGENLTGVLDWERAMYADPVFDLARLYYYQEWARAYFEKGEDPDYESDFMQHVIAVIEKRQLIEDHELFLKKYNIIRATYFLSALKWSINSKNPQVNIDELTLQWTK